jgi:uncharacterized protein
MSSLRDLPWRWVVFFYLIALGLAAPINLGWSATWLRAQFAGTPLAVWPFLPAALGPAVAAILTRRFDTRTASLTSLFGVSRVRSLVLAVLPVAVFGAFSERLGLYAFIALVYSLGEELGWRGYLADALAPLSPGWRYALTAVLWSTWHLRFSTTFDLFLFPVILLAASFALGHAARDTRSVAVAAAMHSVVILLTATGQPSRSIVIASGITLAGWILLGTLWPNAPRKAV